MWQNFTFKFLATGSIWSFSLYSLKLNYVGLNKQERNRKALQFAISNF